VYFGVAMKPTPLRQQFIEVLTLKGYSQRTIETYVCVVAQLARYYHRSPADLSDEEVRAYLHHLHAHTQYSGSTINVTINGLRLFYREVLQRPLGRIEYSLPRFRKRVRRPQAYSVEEVHQLLERGFTVPKYRTFFMTLYGGGLRLSEACHLKLDHIDSRRMLIRVEQGKGHKDRYTILPACLLEELRGYWQTYHPRDWLFPATRNPDRPLDDRTAQLAFKQALERAGLPRKGGPHTLRHSFATHLIDAGTPLHVVKRLLGHTSVTTTAGYLHISRQTFQQAKSPLDAMPWTHSLRS
jgi:integrase/recombinase XerD